jgi:hypothetical protein
MPARLVSSSIQPFAESRQCEDAMQPLTGLARGQRRLLKPVGESSVSVLKRSGARQRRAGGELATQREGDYVRWLLDDVGQKGGDGVGIEFRRILRSLRSEKPKARQLRGVDPARAR